jgi:hypothetical protein
VRDVLAHGAALPESIPVQLVDSALASFIALCLKYDTHHRATHERIESVISTGDEHTIREQNRSDEKKEEEVRSYVVSLRCDTIIKSYLFVANYQPSYHPRAHLKARMKKCFERLVQLKRLDERLKASPQVPNGLKPAAMAVANEEGGDVPADATTTGNPTFTLEGVEAEAMSLARQLQEAIIKRHGALCFLPSGFLPVDYVLGSAAELMSEERDVVDDFGSQYRMRAHFSLREQSKVEILSTLADQVASFLHEVAEKYASLYEMVVSRQVPLASTSLAG